MPRHPSAGRSKWRLVGVIWLAQALLMVIMPGLILQLDDPPIDWKYLVDDQYLLFMLGVVGILTVLQAIFLWPVRKPAPRLGRGASLWLTAAVAALAAGALSAGALMALADLSWLLGGPLIEEDAPWLGWASLLVA